jgi:DNA polymerase-3 subunit epsilon
LRQIVLDTETTGLEPEQGHRVIEIGCVELVNRRRSGQSFQRYLCPDRPIDTAAVDVHGIDDAFLRDKPRFAEIAQEFLEFVRGAELVIHNAAFDVSFLERELELAGGQHGRLRDHCRVLDTLELARQLHPGQRNSLDALCGRYGVDNSRRELHGALLDAQILSDVYLAMTGGQVSLSLESGTESWSSLGAPVLVDRSGLSLIVLSARPEERSAHAAMLSRIERASDGRCLWLQLEPVNPAPRSGAPAS